MSGLKGRDLLTLADFSPEEIAKILDLADRFKRERREGLLRPLLAGRSLAMIFQKPSTRTRVSFEVAMFELGGHALNLSQSELQLARGETIEDTARTLSRYVSAMIARVYDHSDIVRLADAASIPVINAMSDTYHPCQALADLQTIREVKKGFKGLKLAWIGDGDNVCNSLLIACSKMGISVSVASPEGYAPPADVVRLAQGFAQQSGGRIELLRDPDLAVRGADIVVTDTFVSIGKEGEREERLRAFLPKYQVNGKLMERAKEDAIFMHCLPARRGEEVTDEVIDGPKSVVWQEAENRLYVQKALLCLLLLGEEGVE